MLAIIYLAVNLFEYSSHPFPYHSVAPYHRFTLGDCNVPQKYPDHPQLGIWVNKQRMEYKLYQEGRKTSMTWERIQKLESAGFQWAKRKGAEAWEAKFEELVQYRKEHGGESAPLHVMPLSNN